MTAAPSAAPTENPTLLLATDPDASDHRSRGYHPERPERLGAALRAVARCAAAGTGFSKLIPREATLDELARAHAAEHVEHVASLAGKHGALDADTYFAPGSVRAALRAAGACVDLVGALGGPTPRGAALVRPPGHHATRTRAMGFCLFNNAAVAAHAALAGGRARVAIVDIDVHHGNGTQDIFWDDPRVLYVSLHQAPLYPGTGHVGEVGGDQARGATLNVPLPAGATGAVYAAAFDRVVVPKLDAFRPGLVIVSAGFDAHTRDPLAGMSLEDADYAFLTRRLVEVADRHAEGRIALLLEGGYDLEALEGGLSGALGVLAGHETGPTPAGPVPSEHTRAIDAALRHGAS